MKIKILLEKAINLRRVEKALGVKLKNWQIKYILFDKMPSQKVLDRRGSGKTYANCLKILLSGEDELITDYLPNEKSILGQEKDKFMFFKVDFDDTAWLERYVFSERMIWNLYDSLKDVKNIKIRKLKKR